MIHTTTKLELLFLEKIVESLAHVVTLDGLRASTRSQRNAFVWFEVFAKVRFQFVFDVIGLGFRALIVSAGIKESAIFATVHVGVAMRTLVPALHFAYDFDFSTTIVTNHNAPCNRLKNETFLRSRFAGKGVTNGTPSAFTG